MYLSKECASTFFQFGSHHGRTEAQVVSADGKVRLMSFLKALEILNEDMVPDP